MATSELPEESAMLHTEIKTPTRVHLLLYVIALSIDLHSI